MCCNFCAYYAKPLKNCCDCCLYFADDTDKMKDKALELGRFQAFPQPPEGKLFAIADERDQISHDRICKLMDDILASAPRRVARPRKVSTFFTRSW